MQNRTFPRWSAPLVGAVVGSIFGARAARSERQLVSPEWVLIGAAAGAIAGSLIFLLDRPRHSSPDAVLLDSSLFGRIFAVLSVPISLLPFIGLGVAAVALWLNRRVAGWPRTMSWIGAILSAIVSGALALLYIILGPPK